MSIEDMSQAEVRKLMRKAVVFYVAGAPEYERLMDDLTQVCSERQWEKVKAMLDEADEFLADSDVGMLAQKERILAKREHRPDRTPISFDSDAVRAQKLDVIRKDFIARHITFTDHT